MPIPKDEDKFPTNAKNTDLGNLGPGFPLYYEFMKYLCYLMLYLTITYFIPYAVIIFWAYREIQDEFHVEDSRIGLFSFGALI